MALIRALLDPEESAVCLTLVRVLPEDREAPAPQAAVLHETPSAKTEFREVQVLSNEGQRSWEGGERVVSSLFTQ